MDFTELSARDFVEALASAEPVPGGGGAAALAGAVGTALSHMVGQLTVGKKKYAAVEEELRGLMDRCALLQGELLDQVMKDAEGFAPLARAYGLPKEDPDRARVLEEATRTACTAPLRIMELACEAIGIARVFAEKGSALAVSDAGCSAAILRGALEAASLNVLINTKALKDRDAAASLNDRCLELLRSGSAEAEDIFSRVKEGFLK